jgi:hypothetical protein
MSMAKARVLRAVRHGERLIDADTGEEVAVRPLFEPVRLLPQGKPHPEFERATPADEVRLARVLRQPTSRKAKELADWLGIEEEQAIQELKKHEDGDADRLLLLVAGTRVKKRLTAWRESEEQRRSCLRFWTFRHKVVEVEEPETASLEEIKLLVKHTVLRQEKEFAKIQREIELFDKMASTPPSNRRERIPEDVRTLVWRRDNGCCAQCGNRENLEYDHIVPVSQGGSNTARNIELLCEKCNRTKGANVV